ncbi:hypothetical protein [Peribacillus frigoritolerans]|uniref:hypothetical protein n=1 Tax=Peribacillus frigoritolerans TaxID=450367 RepID=UPI0039A08C4B
MCTGNLKAKYSNCFTSKKDYQTTGKNEGTNRFCSFTIDDAYNILKTGEPYHELGSNYLEEKQMNKELKMIEYLKKKGYTTIPPSEQQTA